MASIELIGKAKLSQMAMKNIFGVQPEMDIQEKIVRVFYPPDNLRKAQQNFTAKMDQPPGDLQVEIAPVVTPYILKKISMPAFILFVSGLAMGKLLS